MNLFDDLSARKCYDWRYTNYDTGNITWNRNSIVPKFLEDEVKSYVIRNCFTEEEVKNMTNNPYGIRTARPKAKKVYYDETAGVTVVLWTDGTKTVVRAAEGDKHDAYLGYCTALAKKIHGTNSALKRDLEKVLVVTANKEKGNKDEKV